MSNNEHSPGPWKIEDRSSWASGRPGDDAHVVDKDDGMVVHIPRGGPAGNDPAAQANARLVAAAPETKKQRDELLWTLEYVQGELSGWTAVQFGLTEVLRVIDSVINKATKEEA